MRSGEAEPPARSADGNGDGSVARAGVAGEVVRTFSPTSAHIAQARAFVRETLHRWGLLGDEELAHDLVLAASELVTNAIIHGSGEVQVALQLTPAAVRLVVSDEGGRNLPRERETVTAGAFSGRGLRIVDQVAAAWGSVRSDRGGTAVWLEMPRS
jgi:anti-sigma regulatory factor (Ser/Thr protein kinase)